MNATAFALAGYIAWVLVLVAGIAILRITVSLSRHLPVNSFRPDGSDISPFSQRLCRVHANCYESFPFIGGLLLLALATNATDITNSLALIVLSSRITQSLIHLYSTSIVAAQVRFAFFLVQYAIAVYWTIQFMLRFSV